MQYVSYYTLGSQMDYIDVVRDQICRQIAGRIIEGDFYYTANGRGNMIKNGDFAPLLRAKVFEDNVWSEVFNRNGFFKHN